MSTRFITIAAFLLCCCATPQARALTTDGFFGICEAQKRDCSQLPVIQAYIGGALDLIATLDEATPYLDEVYCKAPEALFDIEAIVAFMSANRDAYANRNAMLLLVRYLEANGGCQGRR